MIYDISSHQGFLDYDKYQGDGVIIRAGYGFYYDRLADEHYNKLRNKTPIGCYWASYACSESDAKREASLCLEWMADKDIQLPVAYDFEDFSLKYMETRGVIPSKALIKNIVKTFLEIVESHNYYVMVYANPNFLRNYGISDLTKRFDLWLAHYSPAPAYKNGLWQYGTEEVPFSPTAVDANIASKDYVTLIKNKGLNQYK